MESEVDLYFFTVGKKLFYTAATLLGIILLVGLIRATVFTYVDVHEFGYTFNAMTGETQPLMRKGYVATPPLLIRVYTIDIRPVQVCITADVGESSRNQDGNTSTATARTLNCKLVRFNPDGFKTWLVYQGSGSYNGDELKGTLKAYAYEDAGRDYSFLEEMIEMDPQYVASPRIESVVPR